MHEKGFNAGYFLAYYAPHILERILGGTQSESLFFQGMRRGQLQRTKELDVQKSADEKERRRLEHLEYIRYIQREREKEKEYEEKLKKQAQERGQVQERIRREVENDPVEQRMKDLAEIREQSQEKGRDAPEQGRDEREI